MNRPIHDVAVRKKYVLHTVKCILHPKGNILNGAQMSGEEPMSEGRCSGGKCPGKAVGWRANVLVGCPGANVRGRNQIIGPGDVWRLKYSQGIRCLVVNVRGLMSVREGGYSP